MNKNSVFMLYKEDLRRARENMQFSLRLSEWLLWRAKEYYKKTTKARKKQITGGGNGFSTKG